MNLTLLNYTSLDFRPLGCLNQIAICPSLQGTTLETFRVEMCSGRMIKAAIN